MSTSFPFPSKNEKGRDRDCQSWREGERGREEGLLPGITFNFVLV